MGAPVAFFEIISDDPSRAQRFYTELFDWSTQPMDDYALFDTGNDIGGGLGPASAEDAAGVRIYLRVDDLDAYLAKAEKLGGTTVVPPMDLPSGYGRIAMFTDPDGNKVGLWS